VWSTKALSADPTRSEFGEKNPHLGKKIPKLPRGTLLQLSIRHLIHGNETVVGHGDHVELD